MSDDYFVPVVPPVRADAFDHIGENPYCSCCGDWPCCRPQFDAGDVRTPGVDALIDDEAGR